MGTESPDLLTKILIDFGLTEGERNDHPKQGTAVRRFFFNESYFEFLYICNEEDVLSPISKPAQYYERITTKTDQISPFGICFRPSDNGLNFLDYNTWSYRPKYLPSPLKMEVYGHDLNSPMLSHMGFISDSSFKKRVKQRHNIGFKSISLVTIYGPHLTLDSPIKQDLHDADVVKFKIADEHLLEIEFDGGLQDKSHDFRPEIPLVFNW